MTLPSEESPTVVPPSGSPPAQPGSTPVAPKPRRRIWPFVLGCGVLLLLGCFALGVGGFFLGRDWLQDNFPELLPSAEEPAVAYILDTSPRMSLDSEGGTRLAVAQAILAEIVRPADPSLTSGLRVFGGGAVPQACEDTELVVSYAPANQEAIAEELLQLRIGGSAESALAQSMVAAIRDLQPARGPHSIVVVTGGADSCNPQAGELLAREAAAAGIDLQTYVVGFQVSPEEAVALKTMAEAAPGGAYYDAPDAAALRAALQEIQRRVEQPRIAARLRTAAATAAATGEREVEEPPGGERPSPGYQSQTACDHPFFPLRQGASWNYSSDGYGYGWSVTSVTGDLSSATATVTMAFEGGSLNFEWSCNEEGVLFYQFGAFNVDELEGMVTIEITSSSGAPLLSPGAFQAGASWSSEYTLVQTIEAAEFSTSVTSSVQETHSAGAAETLSTALGSFEAIPVTTSSTSTMTTEFDSFTSSSTSTCWFGYGVGMLRCVTSGEGFSSTTELVSYSLP